MQCNPRCTSHSEEFWQNMVHWRREWQPTAGFLPREPHEQYEKAKSYGTRRWAWHVTGVQYDTGEEWRTITKHSRKKESGGSKQKSCSMVDVSGDENKVWCFKEQHCIGTGNVRSMNQGKLNMVKQEMANQWTKMGGNGQINSDDHYVC